MDSRLWEADLRAIRAGTAPRQALTVRYRSITSMSGAFADSGAFPEPEREGWLDVYADEAGTRPLVRVPVGADLDLPTELHRCELIGWPAPGRCIAPVGHAALPMGPAYPLHAPPPRALVLGVAAVVASVGAGFGVLYRSVLVGAVATGGIGSVLYGATVIAIRLGIPLIPWVKLRRGDRR